jgi:hypothetical protein
MGCASGAGLHGFLFILPNRVMHRPPRDTKPTVYRGRIFSHTIDRKKLN